MATFKYDDNETHFDHRRLRIGWKLCLSPFGRKPDLFDVYGMDRHRERSARVHPEELASVPEDRFFQSDLSNIDELVKAFQGMDTIIHLAGDPNADATWESLRKNNIEGTYNVFEAAKQSGVRRIIYASSIHVSFGYYFNTEPYKSISEGNSDTVPWPECRRCAPC